jgi:hypothetical protein
MSFGSFLQKRTLFLYYETISSIGTARDWATPSWPAAPSPASPGLPAGQHRAVIQTLARTHGGDITLGMPHAAAPAPPSACPSSRAERTHHAGSGITTTSINLVHTCVTKAARSGPAETAPGCIQTVLPPLSRPRRHPARRSPAPSGPARHGTPSSRRSFPGRPTIRRPHCNPCRAPHRRYPCATRFSLLPPC